MRLGRVGRTSVKKMGRIDLRIRRAVGGRARELSRPSKRRIVAVVDVGLGCVAVYLAIVLRIGDLPPLGWPIWTAFGLAISISVPIFHAFGLYREIFRQSGLLAIRPIAQACAVYGLIFVAAISFAGVIGIPRTVGIIQPILLFLLICSSRIFARLWLGGPGGYAASQPRVLIYGAGSAGRQLCSALERSREIKVIGYLDDDPALHGSVMGGHQILDPERMADHVERLSINEIMLAVPSATQRRRNDIITAVRSTGVHVRTLPAIMDLAHGRVQISDLRELDVQDLLGRSAVTPQPALMRRNIHAKRVLVTGAGGSIGTELCRQVLAVQPTVLFLFEISEYALYAVHRELEQLVVREGLTTQLVPLLGSVTDRARVDAVFAQACPDTIYHAAAYKHVPLVEQNIAEGVRNNTVGTYVLAHAAIAAGVADFVLISTDKAVRPTNIMGTTKRAAELVLQGLNRTQSGTRFAIVRFGNVLGSSGSVVPLFRQQIAAGGPITVTDLRIIRYFMTIPEAAQLVIQAGAMAEGGEVFVLDMGEPVRIVDLARNMIELSGFGVLDPAHPEGDIEIVEVGLRAGEKLYEELLIGNNPTPTGHPRIMKAHEHELPMAVINESLAKLVAAIANNDQALVVSELTVLVPEYNPHNNIERLDTK